MTTTAPDDHAWVFNLVSPLVRERRAALFRHRDLLRQSAPGSSASTRGRTIFGPLGRFLAGGPGSAAPDHERSAPFAVLFLKWERRYPHEWAEAGRWTSSHWGIKELILRRFAEAGAPSSLHGELAQLVCAAVAGPYRCKDWVYAPLARQVDTTTLRHTVTALLNGDDPLPRLRARFLLHVLDNPKVQVRRHTWQRWLLS